MEIIWKRRCFIKKIAKLFLLKFQEKITWKVACDVTTPILGKNGAVNVYSPQKGASEEDIVMLNESLTNFVKIIEKNFKRKISSLVGGGAAGGGTAAGLNGFWCNFRLRFLYTERFNRFRKR